MARSKVFGTGSERVFGAGLGGVLQGYLTAKQLAAQGQQAELEKAKIGLEAVKEGRGQTLVTRDANGNEVTQSMPGTDLGQTNSILNRIGVSLPKSTGPSGTFKNTPTPKPMPGSGGTFVYDEGKGEFQDATGNRVDNLPANAKVVMRPVIKPPPQPGFLSRIGSAVGDFFTGGQPAAPVATPSTPTAANGMATIQASDGSTHLIPTGNVEKARQRDPGLKVLPNG